MTEADIYIDYIKGLGFKVEEEYTYDSHNRIVFDGNLLVNHTDISLGTIKKADYSLYTDVKKVINNNNGNISISKIELTFFPKTENIGRLKIIFDMYYYEPNGGLYLNGNEFCEIFKKQIRELKIKNILNE